MRRNNNTDTPLPPEIPAGQNPPDGAMLDYWLKTAPNKLTLEILDDSGNAVRSFSTDDRPEPVEDKELAVPTYWVRAARGLSKYAGMHRFVWDLHYPPPDALEHEYPISAIYRDTPRFPLGPEVLPGKYTVRLTVNGKVFTQALMIKIDPRVKTPQEGLRQQFELETRIAEAMHQDYAALLEVRRVRDQLNKVKASAKGELGASIKSLDEKTGVLEGQSGSTYLKDAAGRSLVRLNSGLSQLLGTVDSADAAPTQQAITTFSQVRTALDEQLNEWNLIKKSDIPAINQQLIRAHFAPVELSAR
jgi:hypothetical protein